MVFEVLAGRVTFQAAVDAGTWIRALVRGRVLNAKYQSMLRTSLQPIEAPRHALDGPRGFNRDAGRIVEPGA